MKKKKKKKKAERALPDRPFSDRSQCRPLASV
jgi:hypothetical protein